jgi:hypothetical protein
VVEQIVATRDVAEHGADARFAFVEQAAGHEVSPRLIGVAVVAGIGFRSYYSATDAA